MNEIWRARVDAIFLLINVVVCSRAVYHNMHDVRHGFREMAWISAWRAVFASVYAFSYLVVIFGFIDRLLWSQIMVGVSPFVWDIVLTKPAKMNRALREAIVDSGIVALEGRRQNNKETKAS